MTSFWWLWNVNFLIFSYCLWKWILQLCLFWVENATVISTMYSLKIKSRISTLKIKNELSHAEAQILKWELKESTRKHYCSYITRQRLVSYLYDILNMRKLIPLFSQAGKQNGSAITAIKHKWHFMPSIKWKYQCIPNVLII